MTIRLTQDHDLYDVIICGGGMVGLSLGIALARSQIRVAVIEKEMMGRQLEPSFDGRVSAIAYGSKCLLEAIGVWTYMADQAEPIFDIRVSDGDTPFFLHYDHQEIGDKPFGYIIENRHTRYGLNRASSELPTLTIIDGTGFEHFECTDDGVSVHLPSGRTLQARLIVGADGRPSRVRALAGIGATQWEYRQTAIVCTIAHERPHHGLAQERFLPAGPFAVLPMTTEGGIHRSSLVWVEPDDRVQLYMELTDDECVQEIRERVGDYLGDIQLAGPRFSYLLSLLHAKTYVSKRLALIGDAAHGMHPIAGQGVNLGFRDVGVLAQLIVDQFKLGLDVGSADMLTHYQRWRRFDNVTMLAATDVLNRLFSNEIIPIKLARGFGLWAVGKIPPLKRFFMRDAMGLTGDLPEMLKKYG